MCLAKLGKGMLFLVERVFLERDEIRAPLKTPACEEWPSSVNLSR